MLWSYKHAVRLRPDHADAYYNMGNAYRKQDQLKGALDSYKHAVRLNPDYAKAYCNMGIAYMKQGQLKDALDS